jgi:hypothetical protein
MRFRLFLPVLGCFLLLTGFGASQSQVVTSSPPRYKDPTTSQRLTQAASSAYNQKRYAESAALYLYAIERGRVTNVVYYNAACSLALSGDTERAFACLKDAIENGYLDVDHLKKDADLVPLHGDRRWNELVKQCEQMALRYQEERKNPDRARIVTTDIDLFWRAYDQSLKSSPEDRAEIFAREYYDKGSVGLADFFTVRRTDPQRLSEYVAKHPKFYTAVRRSTLGIKSLQRPIRDVYHRMKDLYPAAQFPNVYFCVGGFNGGGTVSNNGLLISAEMQARTSNTPMDELTPWEKGALANVKDLPALIAHELVHFQQKHPSTDRSLLRLSIQEGSASFIGTLTAGYMSERERDQHAYGDEHEEELWEEFEGQMMSTDTRKWLYGSSGGGKRPDDLGYYMGYKICEAFYNNAKDKRQAVADILNIKDFPGFLAASKYAEKF